MGDNYDYPHFLRVEETNLQEAAKVERNKKATMGELQKRFANKEYNTLYEVLKDMKTSDKIENVLPYAKRAQNTIKQYVGADVGGKGKKSMSKKSKSKKSKSKKSKSKKSKSKKSKSKKSKSKKSKSKKSKSKKSKGKSKRTRRR